MHETATDLEQARALRAAVASLVRRFSLSERADVACCGMTVAQAATLETLRREGAMRLGDLGRRMGIQPSTLSRNLARLQERGLVERVSEPGDGRAVRARLTASGRRSAARVELREIEFARSILDRLPAARRRRVLEALPDLLDAVRRSTESCCPGAYDHLFDLSEED